MHLSRPHNNVQAYYNCEEKATQRRVNYISYIEGKRRRRHFIIYDNGSRIKSVTARVWENAR